VVHSLQAYLGEAIDIDMTQMLTICRAGTPSTPHETTPLTPRDNVSQGPEQHPPSPPHIGIIKGQESKAHQLVSRPPTSKKVLKHAKRYMVLFVATQDAFPDHSMSNTFGRESLRLANEDLGMQITMSDSITKMVSARSFDPCVRHIADLRS
jgi:hypothetical protein